MVRTGQLNGRLNFWIGMVVASHRIDDYAHAGSFIPKFLALSETHVREVVLVHFNRFLKNDCHLEVWRTSQALNLKQRLKLGRLHEPSFPWVNPKKGAYWVFRWGYAPPKHP
jgi:hypothetical protein